MAPRGSAIEEQGLSEAVAARIEVPQRGSIRSVYTKLQPSTIDGYRSAIADRLGNSPINISKDENLTRLLDSFH